MPAANGLRHPASASCLGRHVRLAGRCPNNSSLFPPLAAVVVVALGIFSGRIILNFGISERLRALRYPIFTGGAVRKNAAYHCDSSREKGTPERPQTLRGSEIINLLSAEIARSAIKIVLPYPGYRLTSSSSSARFTCSAVGGTASGSG